LGANLLCAQDLYKDLQMVYKQDTTHMWRMFRFSFHPSVIPLRTALMNMLTFYVIVISGQGIELCQPDWVKHGAMELAIQYMGNME
jgi:hypothetical protein